MGVGGCRASETVHKWLDVCSHIPVSYRAKGPRLSPRSLRCEEFQSLKPLSGLSRNVLAAELANDLMFLCLSRES